MIKDKLNPLITDEEQLLLSLLADNHKTLNAFKRLFTTTLEYERDKAVFLALHSAETTNEFIGERFRACAEGMRLVETIFSSLAQYKKTKEREVERNPAR